MKIGLYVHIPFCKSKCYYCDFLSFREEGKMEDYVEALVQELRNYGKQINGVHTISSIFIGGGTPTVLPPFLLSRVCTTIQESFQLEADYEWTIEANPGSLLDGHIELMCRTGVNRVSMGLQACQNTLLEKIGRIHKVEDWQANVEKLKQAGISNINTDIMFGLPGQSVEDFKETMRQVVALDIPHISAYSLIVEEGTVFYKRYEEGTLNLPKEEAEREMYESAKHYLGSQGYNQYEISNWSKEGKACKHNILYWKVDPYIGCGLGAHSYLDGVRFSNETNIQCYIAQKGCLEKVVVARDDLTKKMAMEEFMFLGLRMTEGIFTTDFEQKFGESVFEIYGETLDKWIRDSILVHDRDRIFLSERGIEISNQVFASFL